MTEAWNVEDLPAYRFEDTPRQPMTDLDAAMSAPSLIAKNTNEEGARAALVGHLRLTAGYRHVQQFGEDVLYLQAAKEIENGAVMVRVFGRVYRMVIAGPHNTNLYGHGPCELCEPDEYTDYQTERAPGSTARTPKITKVRSAR